MALLITVLVVGFCMYYLCRHPLRAIKYTGAFFGLLFLGVLGIFGAFALLSTLAS